MAGITSAPELFQSTMDQILKGTTMCIVDRIDGIIIRTDRHEHLQVLHELLTPL